MGKTASVSSSIFDELIVTVESIGVEKTIKTLQNARCKKLISDDFGIDNILDCVSKITEVAKERILHGSDRSDERKIATALSVFYVKNETGYSYSDLKKIFKKDESALHKYYQTVAKIPKQPKTDFDKKLSQQHKECDLLITREKMKS